jgi:hypothetical protein
VLKSAQLNMSKAVVSFILKRYDSFPDAKSSGQARRYIINISERVSKKSNIEFAKSKHDNKGYQMLSTPCPVDKRLPWM